MFTYFGDHPFHFTKYSTLACKTNKTKYESLCRARDDRACGCLAPRYTKGTKDSTYLSDPLL